MKRTWKHSLIAAAVFGSTIAVATGAGVTHAGTVACSSPATKQTFAPWGDTSGYFPITNGTFEGGSGGWTMYSSGYGTPSVGSNQEPWKVNGSTHSKGLSIPAYATAYAPQTCVTKDQDAMRFFYKSPGVSGATLLVKIEVRSDAGQVVQQWTISAGSAGWKVSPKFSIPNKRDSSGQQNINVTLTPINTAATWVVDDFMIDPFVSR
jgi:hypothetical protein